MYSGDAIACRIGLETEEVIDKFWVSVGVAAAVGVPEKSAEASLGCRAFGERKIIVDETNPTRPRETLRGAEGVAH